MKKVSLYLVIIFFIIGLTSCIKEVGTGKNYNKKIKYGLVVHGGAGYIYKGRYTKEQEEMYKTKLNEAITAGMNILEKGGGSIEAVEKVINVLEDSPLFNAGKGAVMTSEKTCELDASIMDGRTNNAGAVAGVKRIKNPISLARKVMEVSPHVMLAGKGAEAFAEEIGFQLVENSYFYTERKLKEIEKMRNEEKQTLLNEQNDYKFGTVGCVALDKNGNLAAGTSTGGMANKKFGRIGDSPIIGAGTYANNNTCAVSATGHGEYFIRNVVTHDISALMEYKGWSLKKAADKVIMDKLVKQNAKGGVIAIDKWGNIAMPFNTKGMFRGYAVDKQKPVVLLYEEE